MFNGHEDRALYHGTLHEALKFFEEDLSSNFGLIAVLVIVALEITERAHIAFHPHLHVFMFFKIAQVYLHFHLVPRVLSYPSQRFGHPRVLGIPIPKSLAFWASPVGDAQNADRFDFA